MYRSPAKFGYEIYHQNEHFAGNHLVFHLDGDVSLHLLHLRRHAINISLTCVEDAVIAIVDGILVPLVDRYQNYSDILGVLSHTVCGCQGAMTAGTSVVPTVPLSKTAFIEAGIGPIQRRRWTVRLCVGLLVVGNVCRRRFWIKRSLFFLLGYRLPP